LRSTRSAASSVASIGAFVHLPEPTSTTDPDDFAGFFAGNGNLTYIQFLITHAPPGTDFGEIQRGWKRAGISSYGSVVKDRPEMIHSVRERVRGAVNAELLLVSQIGLRETQLLQKVQRNLSRRAKVFSEQFARCYTVARICVGA
jgi:hypothetical protein